VLRSPASSPSRDEQTQGTNIFEMATSSQLEHRVYRVVKRHRPFLWSSVIMRFRLETDRTRICIVHKCDAIGRIFEHWRARIRAAKRRRRAVYTPRSLSG